MWTRSAAAPARSKANWASASQLAPGARRMRTRALAMAEVLFAVAAGFQLAATLGGGRRRISLDPRQRPAHNRFCSGRGRQTPRAVHTGADRPPSRSAEGRAARGVGAFSLFFPPDP